MASCGIGLRGYPDAMAKGGKRTRYGEGELTELSPGRWRVSVERPRDPLEPDKRRRYVRIVRGKRSDAIKVQRELAKMTEAEGSTTDLTLRQVAERWHKEGAATRWRGQTPATYRHAMAHLEPLMPHPVASITRLMVADLHARWRADALGPQTIHKAHRVLTAILNQAIRWGVIEVNNASRAIVVPQPKGRADRPPAEGAVESMLAAAEGDLWLFIGCIGATGARKSEMLAVRWQEVDLEAGTINFTGSMVGKTRATLRRGPIKNDKPRRVKVDPDTVAALEAHRSELASVLGHTPSGYVWSLTPDGATPWLPNSMGVRVARLRQRVGLTGEEFWTHGMRHRAATMMLEQGIPLVAVAKHLGQEETTTLRFYTHANPHVDHAPSTVLGGLLARRADEDATVTSSGDSWTLD